MDVKLHFNSNSVKGLQNSLKKIKIFEYLKENLDSNGFGFTRNLFIFSWWKELGGWIKKTYIFFHMVKRTFMK